MLKTGGEYADGDKDASASDRFDPDLRFDHITGRRGVAGTGGAVYDDYPTSTVTVSGTKFADNTPNNCTPSGGGCPA